MRVIAGEFRGRKLLGPQGDVTRPVTDRVKQSLFDILMPYLAGARVYDCFAGTGSMGLECLSRGAGHVRFFETDGSAVDRLKKNIATLGVQRSSHVVSSDLFKWFASAKPRSSDRPESADISRKESGSLEIPSDTSPGVDLVFLDPPYRFVRERPDELQQLAKALQTHHLKPDGIVIFRHDADDSLAFPTLPVAEVRSYGSMTIEFLRPLATDQGQPTTDR